MNHTKRHKQKINKKKQKRRTRGRLGGRVKAWSKKKKVGTRQSKKTIHKALEKKKQ